MTRLWRAVAAVVFALAALMGGGGVASADPAPTPTPTAPTTAPTSVPDPGSRDIGPGPPAADVNPDAVQSCTEAPTPGSPNDGLAGWLDAGPATPGTSLYSLYGYGGWGSYRFAPGCRNSLNPLDGVNVEAGSNVLASWIMGGALLMVAAATVLTRLVIGSSDAWGLFDGFTSIVQLVMGPRILMLALGLGLCATGFWFAWHAKKGDVKATATASWRAVVIISIAVACAFWTATVGATFDKGVTAVYSAINETATTDAAGQAAAGADVATADALVDQVIFQAWALQHLGPNQPAIDAYGRRLHAAAAYTRAEQARIQADPNQAATLVKAKKADFAQVAAEVKANQPGAYEVLAGKDTKARPGYAAIALLGSLACLLLLVYALAVIGLFKIAVRLAVAFFPAIGVVTQIPPLQHIPFGLVTGLAKLALTALALTGVYVAYMVGGVGGILQQSTHPLWMRLVAMAALAGVFVWLWKNRGRLSEATGLDKEFTRTRRMTRRAMRASTSRAASTARGVRAGVAAASNDAPGGDATPAPEYAASRRKPRRPDRPVPHATLHTVNDRHAPDNRTRTVIGGTPRVVQGEVITAAERHTPIGGGRAPIALPGPTRRTPRRVVSAAGMHRPSTPSNPSTGQNDRVRGASRLVARTSHAAAKPVVVNAVGVAAVKAAPVQYKPIVKVAVKAGKQVVKR